MTNKEKIIRDLADYLLKNDNIHEAIDVLSRAYDAGFKAKRCKEDNDNPYYIDHKRQTKLEL